uniref:Uncharacterized protein n=1 Tax=Crocodylus porosus TaxID=8502 RepID=A0A7M4F4R6_CROPO
MQRDYSYAYPMYILMHILALEYKATFTSVTLFFSCLYTTFDHFATHACAYLLYFARPFIVHVPSSSGHSAQLLILYAAGALAVLEDQPKVRELAVGSWLPFCWPKSITVPVEIPIFLSNCPLGS